MENPIDLVHHLISTILDNKKNNYENYPLIENTFGNQEIIKMIDILLGDRLTMGENVSRFEKEFAKYIGSKYAVMVNSGSSANLLALAVMSNYQRVNHLKPGDECIIPAICWSTSVFPVIQMGLTPVFIDVDPITMNMNVEQLESKITSKTKCIVAVHILGNCIDMDPLMKIVNKYNLLVLEDTCEALGTTYNDKYVGTFGTMGTYSFYYSHHITTVEGGMVVCNDENDYELLKCLRAHGWTRNLKNKEELEQKYPDVDPRFLFVNLGYNLRPMEIQAVMGLEQLLSLEDKNMCRNNNLHKIVSTLFKTSAGQTYFNAVVKTNNSDPAWFGTCLFLKQEYKHVLKKYLEYLTLEGVENRPIVTGNIARQPVMQHFCENLDPLDFPGAEQIHTCGFFIGLPCNLMSEDRVNKLIDIMINFDFD